MTSFNDYLLTMETLSDERQINDIRALLGACGLVLSMVCFLFCAYKCIMYRKEQEDRRHNHTVLPMT